MEEDRSEQKHNRSLHQHGQCVHTPLCVCVCVCAGCVLWALQGCDPGEQLCVPRERHTHHTCALAGCAGVSQGQGAHPCLPWARAPGVSWRSCTCVCPTGCVCPRVRMPLDVCDVTRAGALPPGSRSCLPQPRGALTAHPPHPHMGCTCPKLCQPCAPPGMAVSEDRGDGQLQLLGKGSQRMPRLAEAPCPLLGCLLWAVGSMGWALAAGDAATS